jgi:hypothetical protein
VVSKITRELGNTRSYGGREADTRWPAALTCFAAASLLGVGMRLLRRCLGLPVSNIVIWKHRHRARTLRCIHVIGHLGYHGALCPVVLGDKRAEFGQESPNIPLYLSSENKALGKAHKPNKLTVLPAFVGYDRHGQAVMWLGQAVYVPWTCLKPTSKSRVRLSVQYLQSPYQPLAAGDSLGL